MKRRPLSERFWEKVAKRGPDDCWEWTASRTTHGYGQIRRDGHGPQVHASRISWELNHGPIPKGEGFHGTCVLHRCDNPGCVNPSHLFLGTQADNLKDMHSKGRRDTSIVPRGAAHWNAKLNAQQIGEIRSRPEANKELAHIYGVNTLQICRIRSKQQWRSL